MNSVISGAALKYHVENIEVASGSVWGVILEFVKPNTAILELGCATGQLTKILHGSKNCIVDAIEIDPVAAEMARSFCRDLIIGDIEGIDWSECIADRKYDHILMADVLEHIHDPARLIVQLKQFLKPDGCLIISTPNIAYAGVLAALARGWFPYRKTGTLDEGHVHFFTKNELETLLFAGGYVTAYQQAVRWAPEDSEFANYWQQLSPAQQHALTVEVDSNVYQWVFVAEAPSESAWRKVVERSQALAERHATLAEEVAQLRRMQPSVDSLSAEVGRLKAAKRQSFERQEQLTDALCDVNEQMAKANRQRDEALRLFHAVTTSSSWRLTAPLREGRRRAVRSYSLVSKGLRSLKNYGFIPTIKKVRNKLLGRTQSSGLQQGGTLSPLLTGDWHAYRTWLQQYEQLPIDGKALTQDAMRDSAGWPTFSVVIPVFNADIGWLSEAIRSVRRQWYPNWSLHIIEDASSVGGGRLRSFLMDMMDADDRIHVIFRESNGHISKATNDGILASTDDWVTFLDQDDLLAPHALWCFAKEIKKNPSLRVIYSDEDKIGDDGLRREPHFKPDWNFDLLLSYNYMCHLTAYRREDVVACGGLRVGYEGAQDYDLALRMTAKFNSSEILHIPRILYHWRVHVNSTSGGASVKNYAMEAGRKALLDYLASINVSADVLVQQGQAFRVKYALPDQLPAVTLIIPTRNGGEMLKTCVRSVLNETDYANFDVLIIDNGSDQVSTLHIIDELLTDQRVSVIRDPRPFNYAALHNSAVPQVKGELILLMNDDVEVIHADWLSEMVSVGIQRGVGMVGARLLYPSNLVQHAGIILVGGVAGHAHKRLPAQADGYFMRAKVRQAMSGVTAACLLMPRRLYEEIGGMDEKLAVAFNDVDLCLAVDKAGYRIVWTPYAELFHHESVTRGYEDNPKKQARFNGEIAYVQSKWGDRLKYDPAFNPNLDNMREDFSLANPPRLGQLF